MGTLHIVSNEIRPFADREEAGRLVGEERALRDVENPVVLGVPRGGVVVAHALAGALGAELDVVFALKLRFPGRSEFAVGAVAEGNRVILDEGFVESLGLGEQMEEEKRTRLAELSRRAEGIRKLRPRIPLAGRTVIVTDDGVATGSTIRAALQAVRREAPRKLVCAVPVGEEGAIEKLAEQADEMLCLRCPPAFLAVSQFYRNFTQTGEEEIERIFRNMAEESEG